MPKISVVIITYNEEKNIERCLKSVINIADEIVIVDSFSNDRTQDIASRFNVRFIQNKFEGHIQQKNYALSLTTYQHVLSLDADEELSEGLSNSIKEIKENWAFDAYYFNRLTCFYGKWIYHGGWYPDRKLRLWDKQKGRWGGINPHDKVIMHAGTTKCKIKRNLLHYYYNDKKEHIQQLTLFATIASKEYFNLGRKSTVFTILLHSSWRFFRTYFIQAGFIDGKLGFKIAQLYTNYTFLKYQKLRQLWNNQKNNSTNNI